MKRYLLPILLLLGAGSMFGKEPIAPSTNTSETSMAADVTTLSGYDFYRVDGESMLPYYNNNALLGVKKMEFSKLKVGMLIVYHDGEDLVAHRVERIENGVIYLKGYNNKVLDPKPLTESAFRGVVAVTLHGGVNLASTTNTKLASLEVVKAKRY